MTSSNNAADSDIIWIYHERQEALLCGQHALNNLAQAAVFTAAGLAEIAEQLDSAEYAVWADNKEGGMNSKDFQKRLAEGSSNVDAAGNFSIQVLKAALQQQFGIALPHLSQQDLLNGRDVTEFQGFLCHKSDHWFAIRLIGGRFWNLNSMLELPVVVSHFQLATDLESWRGEGYTVFCIPTGLPAAGVKVGDGSGAANWHRMSDLLKGRSTDKDPWENVGSGMRLDGKTTTSSSMVVDNGVVEGLTEEEQLQLALQASLEPTATRVVSCESDNMVVAVPAEPDEGTVGSVRIQFRLPDGKRVVRRFMESWKVAVVYAFVRECSGGRAVELRCGFPPKDLAAVKEQTIGQAKLAGESIQGRYA